ncbi:ribonuclease Z [Shewanella baltica]|nr:MBL fold metallo-hydrolase [Shewanella sp. DAU305]WAL78341.1 MBL fold metallo-hydrolase [Shewanella sp. DAU305]VEF27519.1 ribonuclease Z [Shewanella baltica]
MKVTLNHAGNGDCILVESENSSILIDGGTASSYSVWKNVIQSKTQLDAIVVTHIDSDHINGVIKLIEDQDSPQIGKMFYNGAEQILGFESNDFNYPDDDKFESLHEKFTTIDSEIKIGTSEATSLSYILKCKNININPEAIHNAMDEKLKIGDFLISVLSPTLESLQRLKFEWIDTLEEEGIKRKIINKSHSLAFESYISQLKDIYVENISDDYYHDIESLSNYNYQRDTSLNNETSIALLLECDEKKLLSMGDCHTEVITAWLDFHGIDIIEVDAIKLSHHGSNKNINIDFLKRVKCNTFLISTDGSKFKHPDLETIALISKLSPNSKIIINEKIKHINQNFVDAIYNYSSTELLLDVKEVYL